MTEAEFVELVLMANTVLGQYAMDFISMVFAYVVAGHFVGATLTRVQFVVLTIVYSAFAAGIMTAALSTLGVQSALMDRFLQQHPVEAAAILPSAAIAKTEFVPPFLFVSAWVISVWYVASVRRSAPPESTSS